MCHQVVGLVGAALERQGIVTASITMLPEITRKVRPPRALAVPFPLGFPLGTPDDPTRQRAVLRGLLALLSRTDVPVLEEPGLSAGGGLGYGPGQRRNLLWPRACTR